jgi:hypothetical protein
MPAAEFRFYEELNDYLPASRRKRSFTHTFAGAPAIKDIIEALGVPHTEIDLILVDGRSVRFSSRRFGCHQMMPKGARRSEHEASLQSASLPRMSNHSEFVTDFPQQTPAPFDVRFLLNTLWA